MPQRLTLTYTIRQRISGLTPAVMHSTVSDITRKISADRGIPYFYYTAVFMVLLDNYCYGPTQIHQVISFN